MDVSIVVPLLNEDESLPELTAWITRVVNENNYSYEIILVDDGSTDNSWNVIEGLSAQNNNIKKLFIYKVDFFKLSSDLFTKML